jgi:hypothetical protein
LAVLDGLKKRVKVWLQWLATLNSHGRTKYILFS